MLRDSTDIFTLISTREYFDIEEFSIEEGLSKKLFKKLYRSRKILVNGDFRRRGLKISKGDRISLIMDDIEENQIEAQEMELDIIYEDMDLMVVNKPAFMPVHTSRYHQRDTLSNGLVAYFNRLGLRKKVRIVNRLDENTSGILLVAKSQHIDHQLSREFRERRVVKKYLALVEGQPSMEEGLIDERILKDGGTKKMVDPLGKEALTHYRLIENFGDRSLLELEIITGRSHQIRVHMSHIGHPLVGDRLYGSSQEAERYLLHSNYIKFYHPRLKRELDFYSPLPNDMKNYMKANISYKKLAL